MSKVCKALWESIQLAANGDIKPCCIYKGNTVNFKDGYDIKDAWVQFEPIRKQMLDGKTPLGCKICEQKADSGGTPRKIGYDSLIKNHLNEYSLNPEMDLRHLDINFGNKCNLKCRMCGPTDSNMWYEDTVKLWGPQYTDSGQKIKLVKNTKGKHVPDVDIYSWYENKDFWIDLEKEIPNIERLYIVGGEPLMIDQHYEFLQKCIDAGRAHKIVIEYNTNITNIPERAWNIWKHFERVQIGMSVDAVGPINDYIRNPSKWYKIEENMRKLDAAEGEFKIWWAATIQAYNLLHLPEMMMWKIQQNFKRINVEVKHKSVISPHPLHNPKFLNIKIFPKESKQWIENHFEEWKTKAETEITDNLNRKHFCKILDTYIKYMWAEDYSNELEKFWHYTKTLDQSRKENLKDVCPKTWELLLGDKYA